MKRLLQPAKALGAAALCLNPVASLFVVGWIEAMMRRRTLRHWWEARGPLDAPALEAFLQERAQPGGLRAPFARGLRAALNTWALTEPPCALWLFAWYDGWNNSFHKGYEQAFVAPSIGLLGAALFAAAMLYVPMAQARQAATGEWRRFYDFRLVWAVARTKWLSCLALAALYAGLSLPLTALRVVPNFLPFGDRLGDDAAGAFLLRYSYAACLFVLGAYAFLRLSAARIYAAGLLELVQGGDATEEDLAAAEREALGRVGLLRAKPPAPSHALLRALGWAGTLTGRLVSIGGAAALWAFFVFQIFASQFLNFRPRSGWLNQPFVQLPWFRLQPAAPRVGAALKDSPDPSGPGAAPVPALKR